MIFKVSFGWKVDLQWLITFHLRSVEEGMATMGTISCDGDDHILCFMFVRL